MDSSDFFFLPVAQLVWAVSGERKEMVGGGLSYRLALLENGQRYGMKWQGRELKEKSGAVAPVPSPPSPGDLYWLLSCLLHYWIKSWALLWGPESKRGSEVVTFSNGHANRRANVGGKQTRPAASFHFGLSVLCNNQWVGRGVGRCWQMVGQKEKENKNEMREKD